MTRASLLLLLFVACESNQPTSPHPVTAVRDQHISAADAFTQQYAASRLAAWNIKAGAAGSDCDVLFVRTSIILEDSMIEALHYGAGAYNVYPGGVQKFYRDREFRGVTYTDPSERVWTYGKVDEDEGKELTPCGDR